MRNKFLILLTFAIFFVSNLGAKPADLKPEDVHMRVNEFLYNHISQKKLSPEIIQRTISNFIDLLDPLKLYLSQEDLKEWESLSEERLKKTLSAFYKSDFAIFEEIYDKMLRSIERRDHFEKELNATTLIEPICAKDIQQEQRAIDETDLKNRLLKIRSLQHKYLKKVPEDQKDKYPIFIEKRRKWRELEIIGEKKEDKEPILHTLILKALANALDSQTDFYPPDEANQILMQVQKRLLGIGVKLVDDITGFKIIEILDGGPAKKQGGLEVDDKIIAVDNEPVVGLDIHQAVQKIQGKENSYVTLTVLREDSTSHEVRAKEIKIKRGGLVIDETRLETELEPYGDGVIARVTLHSFYQDPKSSASEDLFQKITEIKNNHPLRAIVLDLRNNTGGLLTQGVAISSFFMGKGIVATLKRNDGSLQHYRNEQQNLLWDGPLIVLINKASASCAEIVAQCLQDYNRAIVVGDASSFGKGTYQITSILPHSSSVNPQGEFKITQGMYFTVSGKSPQLRGVESDIVVPGFLSEANFGEKFSKFPVPSQFIDANFEDSLSDIPAFRRAQYKKKYLKGLQLKTDQFSKHLPVLKENSKLRIEKNQDYQAFLKLLKENADEDESFGVQNDLQLLEAFNIAKDLIYLTQKEPKNAA